jgi:hypothetical protein
LRVCVGSISEMTVASNGVAFTSDIIPRLDDQGRAVIRLEIDRLLIE